MILLCIRVTSKWRKRQPPSRSNCLRRWPNRKSCRRSMKRRSEVSTNVFDLIQKLAVQFNKTVSNTSCNFNHLMIPNPYTYLISHFNLLQIQTLNRKRSYLRLKAVRILHQTKQSNRNSKKLVSSIQLSQTRRLSLLRSRRTLRKVGRRRRMEPQRKMRRRRKRCLPICKSRIGSYRVLLMSTRRRTNR